MPDLTAIPAILASVKAAMDTLKSIKNADASFQEAEFKLRIAKLATALADAKVAATETMDIIDQKDRKIRELEDALKLKEKVRRHMDAYYKLNSNGHPSGAPFCSYCWEVSHKLVHLSFLKGCTQCPHCKNEYRTSRIPIYSEKEFE